MKEHIRRRVIIPLGLVLLILLSGFIITLYRFQADHIDNEVLDFVTTTTQQFHLEIDEDAELMCGLLDFIEQDENIRQAWLERDRPRLLESSRQIFERIRDQYRVTDFYFHGTDRTNFLRVHDPERHSDFIRRFTMGNAAATGKTSAGIELGPLGAFTLRVVRPWRIDGELIGYIELGEEIEHITRRIQESLGLDFIILIDKQYVKKETWEEGLRLMNRQEDWEEYTESVVTFRTIDLPVAQIRPWLDLNHSGQESVVFGVRTADRQFRTSFAPLLDAGGRDVGDIILFYDTTYQMGGLVKVLGTILLIAALAGAFLLGLFWIHLGRIERKLVSSRMELAGAQAELETRNLELHQEQELLRHAHGALRNILAKVPFGVVLIDKQKNIRWLNESVLRMIGATSEEEVIGKQCNEYLCPAQPGECPVLDHGKAIDNSERKIQTRDGRVIPIIKSVLEVHFDGEDMLLETFIDITERKQMEEEREHAQAFLQNIIDGIADNLMVINLDHTIALANKAARVSNGGRDPVADCLTCHQVTHHSTIPCESEKDPCPIDKLLATRAPVICEHTHYDAQHQTSQVEVVLAPIFDETGKIVQCIDTSRDITERKQLEMELGHARKLESVGQLAAGIAHEINTPAQFVSNNINFLQESFNDVLKLVTRYQQLLETGRENPLTAEIVADIEKLVKEVDWEYLEEEIPSAIDQSQDGIDRIAKIVRAMKEFSHPGNKEKAPKDLNEIIETTMTVARNEWKYVADIDLELSPDLPLVDCLADEMGQVFLNIIVNAAHAIADKIGNNGKGSIRISTVAVDDWVEIRIEDSGGGIPQAAQDHIFDPFFTTKDVGRGTGQGLTIAYDVITSKHQGTLSFETKEGVGTTFIVRLPLSMVEA
ncbi:MAG: PAS domain S-box protein [Candidatus Delongbacteria bacterium]|nr:PAS domain S-box protein [Candidatus Delongbacteria bacterium]